MYLQLIENGGGGPIRNGCLPHNAGIVFLSYNWPSPQELTKFGTLVKSMYEGNQEAVGIFREAMARKEEQQKTRNIYLVGETGQGKSTLANNLVGCEDFHVSDAGTGTNEIS
jgi:tRNA U34 5-carboxymethylaminomethyl modifying GTPase MnmE/TrmE